MAISIPRVHAERLSIQIPELCNSLANRGQLVSSAAGEILGIEDQEQSTNPALIRKPE